MRVEDGYVYLTNILDQEARIFVPHPSKDAQNYDLNTKYRTKDCLTCPFCIPQPEAIELVKLGVEKSKGKWTPPEEKSIQGVCIWGVAKKVLIERSKGPIRCTLWTEQMKSSLLYDSVSLSVGVLRIELSSDAPHAPILPVNYTPSMRILTD